MKPLYWLSLIVLLYSCHREPAPTPKLLKKLTTQGVTVEFAYKDGKLATIVATKGTDFEITEITRSSTGAPAKVTVKRNGHPVLDQSYETDSQGRITKIIRYGQVEYENQYDSQGNLTIQTANFGYNLGSLMHYTGNNMIYFQYVVGSESATKNSFIVTQFDNRSNPIYELNTTNGFIFPLKIRSLFFSAYLEDYYNVYTKNNQLVVYNPDNDRTVFRYEYEYNDGLPVKRKIFKPGPNDTLVEDVNDQVLYEY